MTNNDTPKATDLSSLTPYETVLPNGAKVVDAKATDIHHSSAGERVENGVVLARYENTYVTWAYHLEGDRPAETFWGHYSTTITDACLDYAGRS